MPFIGVSRCKGSHPASPSTAGGPKGVSSSSSATPSIKGKPTTIAPRREMSGGRMACVGSKIATPAMARAARDAPRANGFRSGCRRSSIPRPGTGRKGNWPGIESARSATIRSIRICCGVWWSVGAVAGAWWARGVPRAAAIFAPCAILGMRRGHARAAASVRPC